MTQATRTETDSIGPIEVPADAYWGAQTQRSIENFPFPVTERMPIAIIHALALVKQAAARVNRSRPDRVEPEPNQAGVGRDPEVVAVHGKVVRLSRQVALPDRPVDDPPRGRHRVTRPGSQRHPGLPIRHRREIVQGQAGAIEPQESHCRDSKPGRAADRRAVSLLVCAVFPTSAKE